MPKITKDLEITSRDTGNKIFCSVNWFTPIPATYNIKIQINQPFMFRSIISRLVSAKMNATIYSAKKEIVIYGVTYNIVENGNKDMC